MKIREIFLRIITFTLSLIRGAFYSPVVLSFAFFIAVFAISFEGSSHGSWSSYDSGYEFSKKDILFIYSIISLVVSILVSVIENYFKINLFISTKKKMVLVQTLLVFGYACTCIYLIAQTGDIWSNIFVNGVLLIISSLSFVVGELISRINNFINSIFTKIDQNGSL
jgi:membrane-associated HD superfamily phosphohydrolase